MLNPHFCYFFRISCCSNSEISPFWKFWVPNAAHEKTSVTFPSRGEICASTRAPSTALDALDEQSFATAEMVRRALNELRDMERKGLRYHTHLAAGCCCWLFFFGGVTLADWVGSRDNLQETMEILLSHSWVSIWFSMKVF